MKTVKRAALIGFLAGAAALFALPAAAQDITIAGAPATFNVYSSLEEGATPQATSVRAITIVALEGDYCLVRIAGADGYIAQEEMKAVLPEVDISVFPKVEEAQPAANGDRGDAAMAVQRSLIALGLLNDTADGVYGNRTAEAVRAFQTAQGLPVTGNADATTVLLLMTQEAGIPGTLLISRSYSTPEEKFPEIAGKTTADLSAFMDSAWSFSFDVFENAGTLDPSLRLGSFDIRGADIDRISGNVSVKIQVVPGANAGTYDLVPIISYETTGAYRPYLQSLIFAGSGTVRVEGAASEGSISGISLQEKGTLPLTAEAMDLLGSGTLKAIRLTGKNNTFDLTVQADQNRLASFIKACRTLQ